MKIYYKDKTVGFINSTKNITLSASNIRIGSCIF